MHTTKDEFLTDVNGLSEAPPSAIKDYEYYEEARSEPDRLVLTLPPLMAVFAPHEAVPPKEDQAMGERTWDIRVQNLNAVSDDDTPLVTEDEARGPILMPQNNADARVLHWIHNATYDHFKRDYTSGDLHIESPDDFDAWWQALIDDVELFAHPRDYNLNADVDPGVYYWFVEPGCMPDSDPHAITSIKAFGDRIYKPHA
jgi:hypothetical protein